MTILICYVMIIWIAMYCSFMLCVHNQLFNRVYDLFKYFLNWNFFFSDFFMRFYQFLFVWLIVLYNYLCPIYRLQYKILEYVFFLCPHVQPLITLTTFNVYRKNKINVWYSLILLLYRNIFRLILNNYNKIIFLLISLIFIHSDRFLLLLWAIFL